MKTQEPEEIAMNSVLTKQTSLFNENHKKSRESGTPFSLSAVQNKSLMLDFDGGQISSDAGLLILREVEQ